MSGSCLEAWKDFDHEALLPLSCILSCCVPMGLHAHLTACCAPAGGDSAGWQTPHDQTLVMHVQPFDCMLKVWQKRAHRSGVLVPMQIAIAYRQPRLSPFFFWRKALPLPGSAAFIAPTTPTYLCTLDVPYSDYGLTCLAICATEHVRHLQTLQA